MPGFLVFHCLLELAQIHVLGNNCSLQHWTLLSPPDSCTTEHHLHFGPAASFFLELLVITPLLFPVAYWSPSDLGGSSSGVISFCLLI